MSNITSKSPVEDKLLALLNVQASIRSLQLVEASGLGTGNITKALEDLRVFERQLIGYCTDPDYKGQV